MKVWRDKYFSRQLYTYDKIFLTCNYCHTSKSSVVSVFGSGGKSAVFLLWQESFITTGKKRSSSRLSGGLCCCVSFWFWREIGSFFVVAGKFYYDRKKKIQLSVWWVRDHYYDQKKKIQSSVWWVRNHYYDRKKKRYSRLSGGCAIMSVFLVAIVIFGSVQLELNLIQIR